MIGKIPSVLKINKQMNRAKCFLVPAFQRAIAFQIVSRSMSNPQMIIVVLLNRETNVVVIIVVCVSIIYDLKTKN